MNGAEMVLQQAKAKVTDLKTRIEEAETGIKGLDADITSKEALVDRYEKERDALQREIADAFTLGNNDPQDSYAKLGAILFALKTARKEIEEARKQKAEKEAELEMLRPQLQTALAEYEAAKARFQGMGGAPPASLST